MVRALPFALVLLALPLGAQAAKDKTPPKISHTASTQPAKFGEPFVITAQITDDMSDIFEPALYYRTVGAKQFVVVAMVKKGGSTFSATIPGAAMKFDVEYFMEAFDAQGNGPSHFASQASPQWLAVAPEEAAVAVVTPEVKPEPKSDPKQAAVNAKDPKDAPKDPKPALSSGGDVVKPAEGGTSGLKIVGISMAGVGVVGIVVGAVMGVSAKSGATAAQAEPDAIAAQNKFQAAQSTAKIANVAFIAGGALAVGGAILALMPSGNSASATPARSMESHLLIGPGSIGALVKF